MVWLQRLAWLALPLCCAAQPSSEAATLRRLAVPGFEPALLFTPAGATPRPLVVAAHGAGGGPEWECEYWRRLTRGRAFVLCLNGTPLGGSYSGFYFRDHRALEREWVAAEQAARAAEPRILPSSGIYAGFSQGATMGTAVLARHSAAFPYGVLIEGFMPWNVPAARQFVRAGGRRLLLACGSKECAAVAKTSVHWLEVAHAEARSEYAPGAGHTPAGLVMEQIAAALPWLLQGDPHWLTDQ
jgi:predicted esterase